MPKKTVIKKNALAPTVLIAGGAGFIGSHIAEAALKNGARVLVLDNFSTGKQSHVNHLLANSNFALYDMDINNGLPSDIESVDYVIHLAGLEEYLYSREYMDLNSLLTNALGTKNLLDLAKNSPAKFLLISTTDVYQGLMSQLDLAKYFGSATTEENKYMITEAKRYAEALVWEYHKKHNIDSRVVRVPEVYGPRMNLDATGHLGTFLKDLIEGKDITVRGDGTEREFYLYITDAVSGVLKALFSDKTKGNIYSLVDKEPISVLELAYLVRGVADREVNVAFDDSTKELAYKRGVKTPDTFNLGDLEWSPKVPIKEGSIKTLEWFGYDTNTHAFKPAKLIEDKAREKVQLSNASAEIVQPISTSIVPPISIGETPITKEPQAVTVPSTNELFTLGDVKQEPQGDKPKMDYFSKPSVSLGTTEKPLVAQKISEFTEQVQALPKKLGFLTKLKNKFSSRVPKVSPTKMLIAYNLIAIVISALFIFVVLPATFTFVHLKAGATSLQQAGVYVTQLDSTNVKTNSQSAYTNLYKAKSNFKNLKWVFTVVGKKDNFNSYDKLISSMAHFSRAVYYGSRAVVPFESLWDVIRPDTQAWIDVDKFNQAKSEITNAETNMALAERDYKLVNSTYLPNSLHDKFKLYGSYLSMALNSSDLIQPVLTNLPNILGADGEKKYLILFQNSNEIRPTGGFIGSYGVLKFDKGKIGELVIDDIYNPDGQIDLRNISVPAPDPIKTFLKEEKLHIRNANWNPDFTKSADTIEDLYYRVTGEKVDGVIAVDLYFVQNLLRVTGPIFLTAYNEEINAENIYERAQFHSEFNYENGSDQKRSFLTILGSKLLEKVFNLTRDQIPTFAKEVDNALTEKHLALYFSNNPLNALLNEKSWDGSLVKTEGDYLYVVNANVGGTKANYYVKNDYKYTVTSQTRDGLLRGIVELKYTHTATDSAWPGGPYTNYVRVLTQKGTKLTGSTTKIGTAQPQDVFANVITSQEPNYTSYETSFVLNPGEELILTFSYDLPTHLSLQKESKDYNFYWQKQPGTQNDTAQFTFDKPFGTSIVKKHPELVLNGDELKYTGVLNKDYQFYVALQ